MKKVIGALALVLAVFSMFYLANIAFADVTGSIQASPSSQVVDVSDGTGASFTIDNMGGFTSLRIDVKPVGSGSYVTVTGLDNITSTGTYTRTAAQMQNQFNNGSFEWKAFSNSSLDASSVKDLTIQP